MRVRPGVPDGTIRNRPRSRDQREQPSTVVVVVHRNRPHPLECPRRTARLQGKPASSARTRFTMVQTRRLGCFTHDPPHHESPRCKASRVKVASAKKNIKETPMRAMAPVRSTTTGLPHRPRKREAVTMKDQEDRHRTRTRRSAAPPGGRPGEIPLLQTVLNPRRDPGWSWIVFLVPESPSRLDPLTRKATTRVYGLVSLRIGSAPASPPKSTHIRTDGDPCSGGDHRLPEPSTSGPGIPPASPSKWMSSPWIFTVERFGAPPECAVPAGHELLTVRLYRRSAHPVSVMRTRGPVPGEETPRRRGGSTSAPGRRSGGGWPGSPRFPARAVVLFPCPRWSIGAPPPRPGGPRSRSPGCPPGEAKGVGVHLVLDGRRDGGELSESGEEGVESPPAAPRDAGLEGPPPPPRLHLLLEPSGPAPLGALQNPAPGKGEC